MATDERLENAYEQGRYDESKRAMWFIIAEAVVAFLLGFFVRGFFV